jgi:hypothetical protein
MIKFQNYKHYKLPISKNPLNYGKLIIQIEELNLFIVQINRTSIAVIKQNVDLNLIKIFYEGDFKFEFKDHIKTENTIIRTINNKKFTFKNNELTLISSIIRLNFFQLLSNFIMSLDYLKNKQYNNTLTQMNYK